MNQKAAAAHLLAKLGQTLGQPLKLEAGPCPCRLEGRDLAFFWSEKFSALFLQADLGPLDGLADPVAGLESLLRANQLWNGTMGGIFGLNPADGRLYYSYRLDFPVALPSGTPLEDAPVEELLPALLPYILGALEAMEDRLHPAAAWNPDELGPVPPGGFLRV
ncbi:hypothetical protein FACS1894116_03190 [Betaproteobacteria bacterium]|nr:hypothetical protein FACS1894116_03190 [Betaproteobacteria bacterium]GHU22240.1 hypothetical protein FACS189488_02400 [Betaproteobacteria bacterium]GHU27954.1 hypothetical protein FACS189497_02230 [Betaproteobacteria bacterium]